MRELIPDFISKKYLEGKRAGKLQGAVLFVDISGFTEMTKSLMDRGNEGIEILTLTINEVFSPAISQIRENSGFVSVFGGDAFYSIFESGDVNYMENALASAEKICSLFIETGVKETKWGKFDLSVKAGLSAGEIEWGIIENDRQNSYYFKGESVDSAGKIQGFCPKNRVVVDGEFKKRFQADKYEEVEKGIYIPFYRSKPHKKRHIKNSSIKDVSEKFFPKRLMDESLRGEFREVVSVFLSFRESCDLNEKISEVTDLVLETGGYFNRVSYGDKGGFILAFYGAPEGRERLPERAVKMVIAVSKIPDFMICAGMTFGMAFSGFSGGDERAEYTCQGEKVNLAARLMAYKDRDLPSEPRIFVEHSMMKKLKKIYAFKLYKKANVKGFKKPVEIYSVIGEIKNKETVREKTGFVGRRKQLETVKKIFKETILSMKFGGFLKVEGEAGVGKSYFVSELEESDSNIRWVTTACDQIYRYSLNPVHQFLEGYFNFVNMTGDTEKEVKVKHGIEEIFKGENVLDESEKDKMIYLFMDLLGLKTDKSPYGKIGLKNKKNEIFYFLKAFIKKLSSEKSLCVFIDDIHWIDSETTEFLKFLTTNVEEYPFIVVVASRPQNQDEEDVIFKGFENLNTVKLEPFEKEDSFDMVRRFFGSENIPFSTMEFVHEKSEGNPFYIKQILSYLVENKMVDSEFRLIAKTVSIPSDIRSLIVSRFDSFGENLRRVAVRASVIGREFQVNILEKMIGSLNLKEILEDGEKNGIWSDTKKGFYLFSHALIRDSIYEMQLLSERRKLHLESAKSFELLNTDDRYTAFIAYHYDKAEDQQNAPIYLKKAIKNSENTISASDTLKLCDALDKYLPFGREKTQNRLKKANLLKNTENLISAEDTAKQVLDESEKNGWDDIKARSLYSLAIFSQNRGKLEDMFSWLKSLDSVKQISADLDLQGKIYQLYGIYYHDIGDEGTALEYFKKSLAYFEKTGDKISQAHILANIAIFCGRVEEVGLSNVLKILLRALEIANETKDFFLLEVINSNIALTYQEVYLDMEKSLEYSQRALEITKKIGNKISFMMAINNLGTVYHALGQDKKAEDLFKKSLDLAHEIGHKLSEYFALMNLANLWRFQNKYEEYLECINRAEVAITGKNYFNEFRLEILDMKYEAYCALKKTDKALEVLEETGKLNKEVFEGKEMEDLDFKEERISYIKSPSEAKIENMMKMAENIQSTDKRASAFYAIWETSKSLDAAQKAFGMFVELIQTPVEKIKEFKNPLYLIKKRRLENFLKTSRT